MRFTLTRHEYFLYLSKGNHYSCVSGRMRKTGHTHGLQYLTESPENVWEAGVGLT